MFEIAGLLRRQCCWIYIFVAHYNACIAPAPFHAKFAASGENMNHQKKKRGWKLFKYLGSYCNCTCASNIIGSLCTSISETCNSFDWFATSVNDFLALVVVTLSSHKFQAFEWQLPWDYLWLLDWLSVPRYVDFWLLNFMCCCLLKVVPCYC